MAPGCYKEGNTPPYCGAKQNLTLFILFFRKNHSNHSLTCSFGLWKENMGSSSHHCANICSAELGVRTQEVVSCFENTYLFWFLERAKAEADSKIKAVWSLLRCLALICMRNPFICFSFCRDGPNEMHFTFALPLITSQWQIIEHSSSKGGTILF